MRYVNRSHTGRCTTNRLPLGANPEPTFWDLMSASADCGLYRCMRRRARGVHQRLGSDSHAQSRCLIASDCRRGPQRGEYPCVGQNGALGSIVPFERSAMVDLLSASQMQRITALNWECPLTCRACRCDSLVLPDHRATSSATEIWRRLGVQNLVDSNSCWRAAEAILSLSASVVTRQCFNRVALWLRCRSRAAMTARTASSKGGGHERQSFQAGYVCQAKWQSLCRNCVGR